MKKVKYRANTSGLIERIEILWETPKSVWIEVDERFPIRMHSIESDNHKFCDSHTEAKDWIIATLKKEIKDIDRRKECLINRIGLVNNLKYDGK